MATRRKTVLVPIETIFPDNDETKLYWQLLGRFVDMVTNAELILNFVALEYSKVDFPIAKAIFMPLRIVAATDLLNRIIETKHLHGKRVDELQCILQQLGQINRMRNDIVHLGINRWEAEWVTTNSWFARSDRKIRKTHLPEETFDQIYNDLAEIIFRLMRHAKLLRPNPNDSQFVEIVKRGLNRTFKASSQIVWQYRPKSQSAPLQRDSR